MHHVRRNFCGLVLAVVTSSVLLVHEVEAATCPGTQATIAGSMLYTVTTAPTDSTCVDFSNTGTLSSGGNPGDPFLAAHSNYVLLDATNNTKGPADGALSVTGGADGHGTFTIDTKKIAGYSSLVLAIQDGQGPTQLPVWGAFLLANTFGNWAIQELDVSEECTTTGTGKDKVKTCTTVSANKFKGLSDAVIYGVKNDGQQVVVTPLPPALVLFGSALFGLTILGRRRKA
jgi:hypothetical protein